MDAGLCRPKAYPLGQRCKRSAATFVQAARAELDSRNFIVPLGWRKRSGSDENLAKPDSIVLVHVQDLNGGLAAFTVRRLQGCGNTHIGRPPVAGPDRATRNPLSLLVEKKACLGLQNGNEVASRHVTFILVPFGGSQFAFVTFA